MEMLELGVFGGWYFEADIAEYPAEWFENAKLSTNGFDMTLNCFNIAAGLNRTESGRPRAGSHLRTHWAGSSGIAAMSWDAGCPMSIGFRSGVGRLLAPAILAAYAPIASRWI